MFACRRAAAAIGVIAIDAVLAVSAFAQSNNAALRPDSAAASEADRTGTGAARILHADLGSYASAALPSNLIVPPVFRGVVDTMIRRSPTFRRQCLRIASAPRLIVVLDWFQPRSHDRFRARTVLSTRPDGQNYATVMIRPADDPVELIAHELEHVIEQLDHVDLRALAMVPASGVRGCGCSEESFETVRAVRAGRAAAAEVRHPGA